MAEQFDNNFAGFLSPPRGPLSSLETGYNHSTGMYTDAENSKAGNSSTYSFPKELGAELDHWVCFRAS